MLCQLFGYAFDPRSISLAGRAAGQVSRQALASIRVVLDQAIVSIID